MSVCTARAKFAEAYGWAKEYTEGWEAKKADPSKGHFTANEHFELACAQSGLAITSSLAGKFKEAEVTGA